MAYQARQPGRRGRATSARWPTPIKKPELELKRAAASLCFYFSPRRSQRPCKFSSTTKTNPASRAARGSYVLRTTTQKKKVRMCEMTPKAGKQWRQTSRRMRGIYRANTGKTRIFPPRGDFACGTLGWQTAAAPAKLRMRKLGWQYVCIGILSLLLFCVPLLVLTCGKIQTKESGGIIRHTRYVACRAVP